MTQQSSPSGSTTPNPPDSSSGGSGSSSSPAGQADTSSTPAADTSSQASSPANSAGHWQPTGELAKAEQVDESVGADHKVTVLWPKGQPADHALTIKILAKRSGDKIIATVSAANNSGQQVSLLTGMFGGASAVDDSGQSLDFDEFDNAWTLKNPGDSPYLQKGDPMVGDMVMAAPKSGNTFNLYWTQAVNIGGIILIRDIPIVG